MSRCWYVYIEGNALEASSYVRANIKPGCLTGPIICAVYAPNCDIQPSPFSANMQKYIINALLTQVPQPLETGRKKHVYLRAN